MSQSQYLSREIRQSCIFRGIYTRDSADVRAGEREVLSPLTVYINLESGSKRGKYQAKEITREHNMCSGQQRAPRCVSAESESKTGTEHGVNKECCDVTSHIAGGIPVM